MSTEIKDKIHLLKIQHIDEIQKKLEIITHPKYNLTEYEESGEIIGIKIHLDKIKMLVLMNSLI
jgi:hypothetical protein